MHLFLVCGAVARYKVLCKPIVAREYEEVLSKSDRRRILGAIARLKADPRPVEAKQLPEHVDYFRICLEDHRVLYGVSDSRMQVTVYRIAKRRR
jgi:mRNA-degrading endonuclease RelE of RelBE toxin-antitoxin system